MAKYLIDSTDIEIEEVSGTENLKFNLASGNSTEQMIGDLSDLTTTSKSNVVNSINEVNGNVGNLSNLNTTNKSNIVNAINEVDSEVQNKNLEYLVVTIDSPQTISSTTEVNFNNAPRGQGNFTLNNGKIVIGSGINHIRVSGCMFVDNWPGGSYYLWALIQLNGYNVATSINGSSSSTYLSASVPTTIFSVTEGDQIRLIADSPGGGTLRRYAEATWLCVEKID